MGSDPSSGKNGLKKGPWTPEEDAKLVDYIQSHGYGNWRTLPTNAGLERCGKSCPLRWTNYLRPDIKRGRFSFEEEEAIIQLHSLLGNKWSAIAGRLPGRTDNEIKNYWNTHIRKRLLRMGIDPVTHCRLDPPSIISSSFSNSPYQMNVSNLPDISQLVNSELLTWAANSNFLVQNGEESQLNLQSQLAAPADYSHVNSTSGQDYVHRNGFSDQSILDPSPETSTFNSNNTMTNQNLSFTSAFSTPSSSPSPLSFFSGNTENEREMNYWNNMSRFHELILSSENRTHLKDTLFDPLD